METQDIDLKAPGKQTAVFVEVLIDLPLATVWKAFTEAESLKKWVGPSAYTCPYCELDFKVGGKTLICMREPEGKDFWSTATYEEIVPLKKIVYIDSFSDKEGNPVPPSYYELPGVWSDEIKVTVNLQDWHGKTRIILIHEGIPEETHDDCVIGWRQSFDKMEVSLQG